MFCLAPLFTQAAVSAGEVLYNGIVLPDSWPPQRRIADLQSHEPMPVPYLATPPSVIPIDVGRQLLVDDFLIEESTLQRRFHKATYYEGNPVIRPDKRWERVGTPHSAMAFSDGVFYDPDAKLFKMWYRHGFRGGTSYATSKDGLTWEKPALDVQPGTNIVLLGGWRDSAAVWLDLEAADPEQRYKLFQFHRDCWKSSVHTSADGIHWSDAVWTGPSWDRSTIFYNPFRKVWVYSIRGYMYRSPWDYRATPPKPIGRSRRYWECKDFVLGAKWTGGKFGTDWKPGEPVAWAAADRLDSPNAGENDIKAELYNLDAVAYESLMLGLFSVWHSGSSGGRPKINDVMLGFSRDGFHWHRPFREAVIPVAEEAGAWNWANVQSVGGGCLVVGDRLYFYVSGRSGKEDCTGLAFMRRDGFASVHAGPAGGQLTTRPVRFTGKHLFVNADAEGGELTVEVLDVQSTLITPFTRQDCVPVSADSTVQMVRWQDRVDLSSVAGRPVRFRFRLRNAGLYSFWVSPDQSGASRGYVAAGGPGYTGTTDTVGAGAREAGRVE